jgi:nucleoside phosphorylase
MAGDIITKMVDKKKIVFLVAMGFEVEKMFQSNGFIKSAKKTVFPIYEKDDLGLVEIGVSKTMAAAGAQWAISNFETERWVNVGLCGSLNNELGFGDVVEVGECRFHDLDVRGLNPECKIGQVSPDQEYIYKLKDHFGLKKAKCITGDIFVNERPKLKEIIEEYSPDVVEMELTAIAQVMKVNGQLSKLSSLKVVSDKANDEAGSDFDNIEERLFEKIKKFVSQITSSI